jgi:hypothetical protein
VGGSGGVVTGPFTETFAARNRDVDVLFMVDNSQSMLPLQAKLAVNFPAFVQTLSALADGLPNLHIAVVSSDMGAGPDGAVINCPVGGDAGIFQFQPRGTCATSGLNAGATFISNVNGVANYTGQLADVFSCIAQLGQQGCGFEHQLASVVRALGADGLPPPAENAGFLRPDALLDIVLVTNEDDCSAPPDTQMFTTTSMKVSDTWGPLNSYRCNEYGHLCGGVRPPRTTAADLSGTCHSAEGQGELLHIADFAAQLKALKPDPSSVFLGALTGPPSPYVVDQAPSLNPTVDPGPWPQIEHSCTQTTGEYADPAVRIADLVDQFGTNGRLVSICAASFAPVLEQVVGAVGGPTPHCLAGPPGDANPNTSGVQPSCTATMSGAALPLCGVTTGAACLDIRPNAICPSGFVAAVQPNGGTVPAAATVAVHCTGN